LHFKRHAFILAVIECLRQQGSWTGKTHVQKALSLLRDLGEVPVPFDFVLYKHGPYSFDVEHEIEQMQSYAAVRIEANAQGYGVVLQPDQMADYVRRIAPLSEEESHAIEEVGRFVRDRNVTDLERLATASWILRQERIAEPGAVAKRLHSLKPHVSMRDAEQADAEVRSWLDHSNRAFAGSTPAN
jgi:uncharacterized protein YwgA